MYKNLQFKVSSGLKNIIGKDLISDDFSAVFELVKNSFDAHAENVYIEFVNLFTENPSMVITDDGKGMNYDDILNKWLFVAYSAKKDGSEDDDYRKKIKGKRYYAGAKGIGRFSCDKLGENLRLLSKTENGPTEEILVDWTRFEKNAKENFADISIKHQTLDENKILSNSGTRLEIYNLRNDPVWDRDKILKLKDSLGKLVNPFEAKNERKFQIHIIAIDYDNQDESIIDDHKKVNGKVTNNILEVLKLKTTKISSYISDDSRTITTSLISNGELVYRIEEDNKDYPLLNDILVELYFLDTRAKMNFTKIMGLRSTEYGSVFLYKNGIRIYPFGEPSEDSFSLDARRSKRMGSYIGTNDIIGRIEIFGDNPGFIEASSRGDGLVKNSSYNQLMSFFIDEVVRKLESYRINIVRYGIDLSQFKNDGNYQDKLIELFTDINNVNSLQSIEINDNIYNVLERIQNSSKLNSFRSISKIERIAQRTSNDELFGEINKVKSRLTEAVREIKNTGKALDEARKEVEAKESENLFLKSIKNKDSDELVSLMHHIGISSGIIKNTLKVITYKIDKNIAVTNDDFLEAARKINFENQKILSISRFATKANFKVNAENQVLDLVLFVKEYISNVAENYFQHLTISYDVEPGIKFNFNFKPLEMIILIDNLISNSIKAKSNRIVISLRKQGDNQLYMSMRDDGIGIPKSKLKSVFNPGYTTTGGSGIGLDHVRRILHKINSEIRIESQIHDGTEAIIHFNKK